MKVPSRRMPKYRSEPMTLWAKLFLAVLLIGLLIAAYHASVSHIVVVVVALAAVCLLANQSIQADKAHRDFLALAREDSICTFARSFDCRKVDTWVIRAVYEELQDEISSGSTPFPLRAEDDLVRDLRIDPEDIDMSLAPAIAQRTNRTLEEVGHNPYFGKVHTVADLVIFFTLQPKQPNSSFKPTPRRGAA
jgi:hypothetical protein